MINYSVIKNSNWMDSTFVIPTSKVKEEGARK